MKKSLKSLTFVLTLLILISNFSIVYALEKYEVADASSGELKIIESFEDYSSANNYYNDSLENYENLVLIEDDKIIKMEYGIVEFVSGSCSYNNEYESYAYGHGYTNNCYTKDGAYISTTDNNSSVVFKLAGDIGKINISEVNLIPFEMIDVRLSKYSANNDKLHHDIKNDLTNDYYAYSITIDDRPEYLDNDNSYYSYDGHYFYNDFKTMIDDYRNDTYENSINDDNPYYNYYEYLPHRSYTNYSLKDVEDYFSHVLYIDGKIQFYDDLNLDSANDDVNLSQLHNEIDSFFGYEKIYGANAMMMLSLATHESAYGKSYLAFTKNNLFGHAAYDSESERNASRYNRIDTSVYSHAKYYISRTYGGVHSSVYHGSFLGNKLSGMNVNYSSDPYWGEKTAANYYRYDEALGFKDKNSYALGIVNAKRFNVYKDRELSSVSFKVNDSLEYSFILLEDLNDVYKVQVDASYSDEYLYNPVNSIGYISKDLVSYVINEEKIETKEYKTVEFDFDGGTLINKENLEIVLLKDAIPNISEPIKDGYEFVGFDNVLSKDTNVYKAEYKKIKDIQVISSFNKIIEYGYIYNLKGGKLKVTYEDGTSKIVDIDTNMIESYDTTNEDIDNLVINYCGVEIEYPITISKEINECRKTLDEYIDKNIESYTNDGTYNLDELNYIKDNLRKVDYLTTFDDIRYIDKMLLENTRDKVNYHFKDSKYDVSISGLALSLKDPEELSVIKPYKDTYYVEVNEASLNSIAKLSSIAKAYGFNIEDSFDVSVSYNFETAKFDNPIIIEVKLQDKQKDKIYTVYHLDENDNVIKCMATQSENYVSFMTRSEGEFMILSMDSVNTYDIEDRYENMSIQNADPDNHLLFIEGAILAVFALLGFIMIIVHNIGEKKKEKLWNDYKRSLQEVASHHEEKPKN